MKPSRIYILVSSFNPEVTQGLLAGALAECRNAEIPESNIVVLDVPGAFELPLVADRCLAEASTRCVVALGCVIKGETAHSEYISEATAHGLMQVSLKHGKPAAFGVLTTYTDAQAQARAQTAGPLAAHNKGREAANAALKTSETLMQFNSTK